MKLETLLANTFRKAEERKAAVLERARADADKEAAAVFTEQKEKIRSAVSEQVGKTIDSVLETNNPRYITRFLRDVEHLAVRYNGEPQEPREKAAPYTSSLRSDKKEKVGQVAAYVRRHYKPGQRINTKDVAQHINISSASVCRYLQKELSGMVDRKGKERNARFYRRFAADADELVPHVQRAWKKYGYVSAPLMVKLGYGDREHLRHIGKALRYAVPRALEGEDVEKTVAYVPEVQTHTTIYYLRGKDPKKLLQKK